MTTEQTQHARDSAELRRLFSERDQLRDQLREKVAEQAREIAVLKANVVTDNSMVIVSALAELERLKAQPSAAVPDSVVWIDAHHIQPGNNPSFIRDVALVSAVKTTETQVPLVRLNQPASAGDERVDVACWVNDQQLLLCSKSPREDEPNNPMLHGQPRNIAGSSLRTDYCNTPLYVSAALSANHSEQVREVPSNCRQRLVAEGKAYPKSSCAVCGQFSPKWRECDAMLTAPSAGSQKEQK